MSGNRLLVCLLVSASLLACAVPLFAEGMGRTADDVQDLVFLADDRPVLLRLHVLLDGKPYRAAWRELVQHVMKQFDADKDGVLSQSEIEKMPAAQLLFGSNLNANFSAPSLFQLDGNNDGKVTLEELETYFRRNGGPPFQFQVLSASPPRRPRAAPVAQPRPVTPDAFNEVLFGLLDADKDGKLSREELAAAPRVLMQRDEDDDEVVTVAEVLPDAEPNAPAFVADDGMMEAAPATDGAFVVVNPNESGIALARRLQMKYGREENQLENRPDTRRLTRKDLGLDEDDFKQLDADGDGWLDLTELSLFPLRPPHLEILVRLGKRQPKEPVAEVLKSAERPTTPLAARTKQTGDGLALDVGVTRVELRAPEPPANPAAENRQRYQQQFKALDRDGNGYLEMNEVQQIPFFKSAFKVMDADGDGQLFEKEMLAYLEGIEGLRARAQSGSVLLTIAEQGRGLFDLLDADHDGRLSLRELRQAAKLLDTLDRNGDGQFSRDEVPRNYPLTFGPGAGDPFRGRGGVQPPLAARQPPERGDGPVWFRKMDRNRDGDVSRREFLGSDAAFAKLDADGDGLISLEEAQKADAKLRQAKATK